MHVKSRLLTSVLALGLLSFASSCIVTSGGHGRSRSHVRSGTHGHARGQAEKPNDHRHSHGPNKNYPRRIHHSHNHGPGHH
jgi:hypothetical protein